LVCAEVDTLLRRLSVLLSAFFGVKLACNQIGFLRGTLACGEISILFRQLRPVFSLAQLARHRVPLACGKIGILLR
jgi:hypothetical protein